MSRPAQPVSNSPFEEPLASQLDKLREEARSKHRITHDCFNAIYKPDKRRYGDKVFCRKDKPFNRFDGMMSFVSVLRGRTSSECLECTCYDS